MSRIASFTKNQGLTGFRHHEDRKVIARSKNVLMIPIAIWDTLVLLGFILLNYFLR